MQPRLWGNYHVNNGHSASQLSYYADSRLWRHFIMGKAVSAQQADRKFN
jgi:hypothetical protein